MEPKTLAALLEKGDQALARRQWPEAAAAFDAARLLDPQNARALHGLGCSRFHLGDHEQGLSLLREASQLAPALPLPWYSLGSALLSIDRFDQAIPAFQQALKLQADSPQILVELAKALSGSGQHEKADETFLAAATSSSKAANRKLGIEIAQTWVQALPESGLAHLELGTMLAQVHQPARAREHLEKAIALLPGHGPAWCNLGLVYEELGQIDKARQALEQASRLMPSSAIIQYHLGAIGQDQPPKTCPPEYLVPFFNEYAPRFEQHLLHDLRYVGPQLLFDAVAPLSGGRKMDILDLGCGTGLCGKLFRPMARTVVGVDLAEAMIDQARQTGIYDELSVGDVVAEMNRRHEQFDLLLAADVFIYIGELSRLLAAAASALRAGGLFAFTLERLDAGDYALLPTRRYAHSLDYLRKLTGASWEEVSVREAELRMGETGPVQGYVVVLRKRSDETPNS